MRLSHNHSLESLLTEMVILPAKNVDEAEVGDEVDGLQGEPAGAEHHHHGDQHAVRPLANQGNGRT